MSLPAPVLYDAVKHQYLLQQIAQIHADCVLNDGTVVTFHPDETGQMDIPAIVKYWEARSTQVTAGTREIIMQFADDSEEELIGYVSLDTPVTQTGAFRGAVEKLLVSPKHRYKGIARRLMAKLEDVAWAKGRVLLVSSRRAMQVLAVVS